MAGIYFVPVVAHGMASALGTAAYAHVCAKTPNLPMLEWTQVGIPFTQLWLRRVVQAAPHRLPRHKIWWPAE
jgi:L-alanine-DL-glutamate epimerase-like enolase superfamily enzyme